MPQYLVSIPVYVHVTVEADTEGDITPELVETASVEQIGKYAQVPMPEVTSTDEYTVLSEV